MIHLSELKKFNILLDNKNTETIKKLCILKKLETWEPVKDFIVISDIGKTVFKLAKYNDEIGIKAAVIIRKWKTFLLPTKSKIKPNNERQSSMKEEITQKKNSLSLKDYYKRKGIEISDNSSSQQAQTSSINNELTADLGLSFMDCLSVRPSIAVKPKKTSKLIKISEMQALTDRQNIVKRNDIVNLSSFSNEIPREENITKRVETSLKYWQPKAPKYNCHYTTGKQQQPETLLKICQDVLLIYRAHIEEVYLTPRELLSTVLDNYNPDQLINFESFNPHYIADNGELWKKHFINKFPDRQKHAKESWRDAFMRVVCHNSEKFELSIQNMKKRIQDNKKDDEVRQIKVLKGGYRIPEKRRFFYKLSEPDSAYSGVTRKLRKLCRMQCSRFRF